MADSAIATGAIMVELREAGGSGGNSTSSGGWTVVARRQPVHGLQADQKRGRDDGNGDQNCL